MKSNLIGIVAWGLLGILGLFATVDLGFGPIVICPRCGAGVNLLLGLILITVSVAAFITNRASMGRH